MDWDDLPEVALAKPEGAAVATVRIEPDHMYVMRFDLGSVDFSGNNGDLVLTFDDKSSLVLQGFFPAAQSGGFYLSTEEGDVLLGKDLADMMLMDLHDIICDGSLPLQGADDLGNLLDAAFASADAAAPGEGAAAQAQQAPGSATPVATGPAVFANAPGAPLAGTELSSVQDEGVSMEHYLRSLFL